MRCRTPLASIGMLVVASLLAIPTARAQGAQRLMARTRMTQFQLCEDWASPTPRTVDPRPANMAQAYGWMFRFLGQPRPTHDSVHFQFLGLAMQYRIAQPGSVCRVSWHPFWDPTLPELDEIGVALPDVPDCRPPVTDGALKINCTLPRRGGQWRMRGTIRVMGGTPFAVQFTNPDPYVPGVGGFRIESLDSTGKVLGFREFTGSIIINTPPVANPRRDSPFIMFSALQEYSQGRTSGVWRFTFTTSGNAIAHQLFDHEDPCQWMPGTWIRRDISATPRGMPTSTEVTRLQGGVRGAGGGCTLTY
jgi:hypothetical protein